MLTEIRSRATGWIAWFIVILISIPFALWGVNQYFEGPSTVAVALVDGDEIDQQTYRYALEERRAAMSRLFGADLDPNIANSPEFRRAVLNGLIDQRLLQSDADGRGYRIGDEQLNRFIRSSPQFQRDGKFAPDLYESAVRSLGLQLGDYEYRLRQQHTVDHIRISFTDSAFSTEVDLQHILRLALQRREFDYATIEPDRFRDDIEITESDIQRQYEENSVLYQTPEQIKVQYVTLSVTDLAENVTIGEEELLQAYETSRDRFRVPEQRRVSHILIAVKEEADEEAVNRALEKAQAITAEARGGADFATLARDNSDDPGSASKGGDLGVLVKGAMVPPFEEAAYSLKNGEVSDPVKTRFGYHVIKVNDVTAESVKTFEQVRKQIEKEEKKRLAESRFIELAETFRNLVYEQPTTLEPVVEALDLNMQTTDWFSRDDGAGVAANPRVREAAFSDEVYLEGFNSETIEIDVNTLVALRKLESRPATPIPLDSLREQIEEALREERARNRVQQLGEELVDSLRNGDAWEAVLQKYDIQSTAVETTRLQHQQEPSREIIEAVFGEPRPSGDGAVYGGGSTAEGAYTLYRLRSVTDGDPSNAQPETVERFKELLTRRRGYDYFLSYQQGLRNAADITIFQEQL